jgi:hypothetical protein
MDPETQAKVRAASSLPAKIFAAAGPGGLTALALVAVSAFFVVPPLWHMLRGVLTPSPEAVSGKIDAAEQAQAFKSTFASNIAQTNGRSLFYVPSAPGTEATVVVEPEVDEGGTPRAPSKYEGPAIQAIVLDEVWFADSTRVALGKKSGDLEVLAVNAPWDAKIRWKGGEFTVPLFARDRIVFKDGVKIKGMESAAAANITPVNQSQGDQASDADSNMTDDAEPAEETTEEKPAEKPAEQPTEKPDEKPTEPPPATQPTP